MTVRSSILLVALCLVYQYAHFVRYSTKNFPYFRRRSRAQTAGGPNPGGCLLRRFDDTWCIYDSVCSSVARMVQQRLEVGGTINSEGLVTGTGNRNFHI